jgi:hypothetical protein
MGLLRNASGLLIPDAFGGKPGRADDPEFHIRRLHHFGQGMGVDLTSTHPNFSRKHIARSPVSAIPTDLLQMDSHGEGIHLPQGHINAGSDAIQLEMGSEWRKSDKALSELHHRAPFHNYARTAPRGSMYGNISTEISDGDRFATISEPWDQQGSQSFKDADKLIRSEFGNQNRNRSVPSTDTLAIVNRAIQHPAEESMRVSRRQLPSELSPQFLSVRHFENDNIDSDHIDLETGNWAKIDPEGYFPD